METRSTDQQADAPQGRSSIRNDPAVAAALTRLEALFPAWRATPTVRESRRRWCFKSGDGDSYGIDLQCVISIYIHV